MWAFLVICASPIVCRIEDFISYKINRICYLLYFISIKKSSSSLSYADRMEFSDFHPCPQAGLPDCILCLHTADVCKYLLVGQHWRVHE